MHITQRKLLSTRRFLPLFITQFLGAFNDNIFRNALLVLITYRMANIPGINPHIMVTFAGGIFILPFFLFSATAGQLADKYDKSFLIKIIKTVEVMLMILATFGLYLENLWLLLFVLFGLGTHSTFFGPIKYAILPDQLHEHELIAGNGLIEAGTFLAILLGTILGEWFILRDNGSLIISTLLISMASCGLYACLFIPKKASYNSKLKINPNFISETFKLIHYSKQRWDIYLAIIGISWFWVIGATFVTELPIFAKFILNSNQNVVAFFLSLFSIGMAIGSLLCNKILRSEVHATYVPWAALGITLFTIDLYFAATHISLMPATELLGLGQFLDHFSGWRIAIDLLCIAICGGIYSVPLYAIIQQRSAKEHRARVIASNNIMNALFMVSASVVTMFMQSHGLSVAQIFLIMAICNLLFAVALRKLNIPYKV